MRVATIATTGQRRRISSESVWPLRGADGLTFAERKAKREAEQRRFDDKEQ